jgi:hypothetical protein
MFTSEVGEMGIERDNDRASINRHPAGIPKRVSRSVFRSYFEGLVTHPFLCAKKTGSWSRIDMPHACHALAFTQ